MCASICQTYPDPVRVVAVGAPVDQLVKDPDNPKWGGLSIEVSWSCFSLSRTCLNPHTGTFVHCYTFPPLQLCGGTHLGSTAEAGSFYIVEESAISAGTRRIIAVTLNAAEAAANRAAELQTEVETANSKSGDELKADINRITGLVNESLIPAVAKANLRAKIKALDQRHRAESKVGKRPLCVAPPVQW